MMHGRLVIVAIGLSLTSLLQAASPVVVLPGDTLATKGGFPWNLPETNINLKIATAATPAAKYTNAVGTGAGMLGLSYTDFAQYGQVTITGTIPANALNLDNSSYLEIGLITQAMVAQSEAWYLSGMFNDSVFMLISTTSSGQYSACAGDYNLGGGRWSSKINFDKTAALSYRLVLDFTTSQASLTVDNGSGYSTPVTVTFGIADWTAGGSTIPGLTPEDYSQAAVIAQLYNEGDSAVNSATFGDVTVYGGLLDELSLNPTAESLYVKTGESVIIDMDVANLQQMVNGCQALLGYSSTYFPAAGTVAAGGGVWSELIYESWNTGAGELDTAIGVTLEGGPAGTQDDGTVAVITLTAGPTEGTTRMVFRPDGANGYATMLSDLNAAPVWPNKIDSVNIIIDNTPPAITCPADVTVTAAEYSMAATATDALAGIDTFTMNGVAFISPTVVTLVPGANTFTFVATDKAGNAATKVVTITYNQPAPTINVYRSLAPNKYGSPSWAGWLGNAVTGALANGAAQGSGYAAFEPLTTSQDFASVLVTGFHSWKGLVVADPELGTAIHFVWRLDNGVQANPGAAKLDVRNISLSLEDVWVNADDTGSTSTDYGSWWNDAAETAQFGGTSGLTSALKGFNWNGSAWVEVTSGTQADVIIYAWLRYGLSAYSEPPATDQDVLNTLYKQTAGSLAFAPDPRQTLDRQEMEVTYNASGVGEGSSGTIVQQYKSTDGTNPVITLTAPTPAEGAKVKAAAATIAGTAFDDETLASGIREVTITLNGSEVYADTTQDHVTFSSEVTLAEGTNTIVISAKDFAGNTSSVTRTVLLDTVPPVIGNLTAVQSGLNVLGCANPTLQGQVQISVEASDASAGLVVPPTLTVTQGAASLTATYVDENPAGTFNYTITVDETTANGTWTITATAKDEADNSASTSGEICVNKNQVTGTISYSTLSNGSFSRTRNVVLVATDSAGTVLKSWTVAVVFANSAGTQIASGTYTLTDVPAGMAKLSAKTAWHLRKRQAVTADGNGQTIADFTLLGGDIKQDNIVNILDYSLLKSNWNTTNAAADINGDGVVQLLDYSLQKGSWFKRGDDQ